MFEVWGIWPGDKTSQMTIDMSLACWFVLNEGEMTLSGENNYHNIPHKSLRIHSIAHFHIRHFFVEKI